jgi:nitroreductase/uncharacterized protein YciI
MPTSGLPRLCRGLLPEYIIFLHAVDPQAKRPIDVIRNHCEHLDRLNAEGRLIAAGPFTDLQAGGMVVGEFPDLEQAEDFARNDPFVQGGYARAEIRPWAWSHPENGHLGVLDPHPGSHPRFLKSLLLRATARDFSEQPMPHELVHSLLTAALAAPSEFNLQPWRPIICHSDTDRQRLQRCCLDQSQVSAAGLAVICAVDPLVFEEEAPRAADELIARGSHAPDQRDETITFIRSCFANPQDSAIRNGTIFGHQLLLAGLSQGLAGFWLGGLDQDALKKEFGIPDRVVIAGVIGLGWPLEQDRPGARHPMEEVVGWGSWPGEGWKEKSPASQ